MDQDRKKHELFIKLPGETVKIGPGTVPTSSTSISSTSISGMISGFKKASKMKLFDNQAEHDH